MGFLMNIADTDRELPTVHPYQLICQNQPNQAVKRLTYILVSYTQL